MNIQKAIDFVRYMVDTYGVKSFFDNLNDEYTLENAIDENDIWVECVECGEPILLEDYPEFFEIGAACPICGYDYEEDV